MKYNLFICTMVFQVNTIQGFVEDSSKNKGKSLPFHKRKLFCKVFPVDSHEPIYEDADFEDPDYETRTEMLETNMPSSHICEPFYEDFNSNCTKTLLNQHDDSVMTQSVLTQNQLLKYVDDLCSHTSDFETESEIQSPSLESSICSISEMSEMDF